MLKIGLILLVLSGCATPEIPKTFAGQCILQPIAAQDGLLLANVQCEAK